MPTSVSSFVVECLYGSFVLFFYYYVAMTLVSFKPFAFGFHPPTNMESLSAALLIISASITFVKLLTLLSFVMNSDNDTIKPVSFTPGNRP